MAKRPSLSIGRAANAAAVSGQSGRSSSGPQKDEPPPRFKWLLEVNENPKCSPMTVRVALCFSKFLNWKGKPFRIYQKTIAQMAHTTVRTVQEHVAILKAEGHLDVRVIGGDRHNGNEFTRRFRDRQSSLFPKADGAAASGRKSDNFRNDISADTRTTVHPSCEPQFTRHANHSSPVMRTTVHPSCEPQFTRDAFGTTSPRASGDGEVEKATISATISAPIHEPQFTRHANHSSPVMRTTVHPSCEPQFTRHANHSSHTTLEKKPLKIPLSIPPPVNPAGDTTRDDGRKEGLGEEDEEETRVSAEARARDSATEEEMSGRISPENWSRLRNRPFAASAEASTPPPAEPAPRLEPRTTAAAADGRAPREVGHSLLKLVSAELAAMPIEPAQRGAPHRPADRAPSAVSPSASVKGSNAE